MDFVIVDGSTSAMADDAHGGPLTPALLQQIAGALEVQLNAHVSSSGWGGNYRVRVASGPQDVIVGEIVYLIVDTLPGDGIVAYHTADGAAHPLGFGSRAACNSILSGAASLACAASHELVETAADAFCNAWRDAGNGSEVAQETADPTESDTYEIDGVTVSNFATPSYFGVGAPGPWTYLGTLGRETVPGPFGLAAGGYMSRRTGAGDPTDVFGEIAAHKRSRASHAASRLYRRGARLT